MTAPAPSISTPTGSPAIRAAQSFLNSRDYPTKANFKPLVVDGVSGPLTETALIKVYQYFAGVNTDGKFGPISKRAANTLRRGSTHQWWVRLLQSALNANGYKLAVDGDFGVGTEKAVRDFQSSRRITSDGIAGANTWEQ
ncbi:peptidoglycan-binding domain-containing protein [Alkalicoccobacillus murimartini]|uniref:Peptidoglycan hydrolase-like protein with peptidoglycan-binding domain n=1 Tax=Alkalicoccobacillus murimartini TaxID=171685 RepID=A0ABT9YE25_9BACI|nr:peptidoglycan-binding protein [Alkalicoccobacillus murimartini]MDQ0206090.1 peptidoglycan hydrolase-like protein with peptidoglycan-binding domain [Alkalicoccobacillus murimartini]